MKPTIFVDVILPVPIAHRFTYRLKEEHRSRIQQGVRVAVPFGKNRILTGIVENIHSLAPKAYEARYIYEILDDKPVMVRKQIEFMDWMAGYYLTSSGEVLSAALPSGLKISTESYIQLHPAADYADVEGDELLEQIFRILQDRENLTYSELKDITGSKNAFGILQYLSKKGVIILFEEIRERFTPRHETYIRLSPQYAGKDSVLNEVFSELSRAPKQEEALLIFLQQLRNSDSAAEQTEGLPRESLTAAGASPAALLALIKKNILESEDRIVSRFPEVTGTGEPSPLSERQQQAADAILDHFEKSRVCLLHGVTGSGKTEIYMHLIQAAVENGSQVLYLLPEIALTTQIVERLRAVFGEKLGVYHSRFSDNERVEVWQGVLEGRYAIVVGVRSSVFLPFEHLGLVIVDEEHEHSYKQYDPAPRYHARDAAIMLAAMHDAKALLGSATPSLESAFQAQSGKYGYVRIDDRFGGAQMPEVRIIDILKKGLQKKMNGSLSDELTNAIGNTLDRGEQVILFQNRRGYSPYLSCGQCGYIPHCSQCSVSLTYHQYGEKLICHYCGMTESVPSACDACGAREMKAMGTGTEKLEEEISLLFPEARVQRMDLDTTRSKNSYERILGDFARHEFDILVGTQMVTKGLDFGGVGLVGIIDLDLLLHYPDFRSHERAFQMAIQVSGRAGRRESMGLVLIQTRDIKHDVVRDILRGDYDEFYRSELRERRTHLYPPFSRMLKITLRHRDRNIVREGAHVYTDMISGLVPGRILGPQEPLINRIRNEHLYELWIKLDRDSPHLSSIKKKMADLAAQVRQKKLFRSLKIIFNVDPY